MITRRRTQPQVISKQSDFRRDFPDMDGIGHRKAVCKRCHVPMGDLEPLGPHGEYYHPVKDKEGKTHWCPNAGKFFSDRDLEVEPFLRKARRRTLKRLGIRP